MPTHTVLPTPTWTQSDNNLLPKWRKYVEWHAKNYGTDELEENRRRVGALNRAIEQTLEVIENYKQSIRRSEASIEDYRKVATPTDDDIMAQYQHLIDSPHVAGTAIGLFGELRVLIDPQIEGFENTEFGVFELCTRTSGRTMSVYQVQFFDETSSPLAYRLRYERIHLERLVYRFDIDSTTDFDDRLRAFELRSLVDNFVEFIIRRNADSFQHTKSADRALNWSGHNVADPVAAMKAFLRLTDVDTAADHIKRLEDDIKFKQLSIRDYTTSVRGYRKELRDLTATIAKLEAAKKDGEEQSDTELAEVLRKITTMPGVIGIKFKPNGVPMLHIRASFVHDGKRYDLGDYELALELHTPYFGTVPLVRRTRRPAGEEYTAGWHDGAGFCFGNRTAQILTAFNQGDFVHMVNLALGTMNSITEGHFRDYRFAEIPMNMVWNRQIRRRQRRRTAMALGATALAAAS